MSTELRDRIARAIAPRAFQTDCYGRWIFHESAQDALRGADRVVAELGLKEVSGECDLGTRTRGHNCECYAPLRRPGEYACMTDCYGR